MKASIVTQLALSTLVLCGAACTADSDSGLEVRTTSFAAEPTARLVISGDWLVYFAKEAGQGPGGTSLNTGDTDKTDQVAFAVNMRTPSETNLQVAALDAAIVGNEIYLKVSEALDGQDWDGLPADNLVLLHWSAATGTVAFVDTLMAAPASEPLVVVGSRLFYAAEVSALTGDETNLRCILSSDPLTPMVVDNATGGGGLVAHLYGQRAGLVFAFVDETDPLNNGAILNGDALSDDTHVLALLNGTLDGAKLVVVGLALASDNEPLAARVTGANDWLAAFLVDEEAQGTSLNRMTLFSSPILPPNCITDDLDTMDQVLHYLNFAAFQTGTPAVNTGLVGHDRVLILNGVVATISDEDSANCDLNGDGDDAPGDPEHDDVARWVATSLPNKPEVDATLMHALASGVGGGSFGLSSLGNRLVAVIDEEADENDFDTQAGEASADHDLVAWIDPTAASPAWQFAHQASDKDIGTGVFDSTPQKKSEPFAGASWMAAEEVGGRLGLVFLEEVPGATNPNVASLNSNVNCSPVAKDTDKSDGLPVWADFEAGPTLDFDGLGYACNKSNAGIEIAAGQAYFRLSEGDDNRDYNGDGQLNDQVLFRNPLTRCAPLAIATASAIVGPVIITDRVSGAAFLSDEAMAGADFNNDGDTNDVVVRYFLF